jgi:galactokinase
LTGAGFGGCIVALVPAEQSDAIATDATAAYRARTGLEPTPWIVEAADGAGATDTPVAT